MGHSGIWELWPGNLNGSVNGNLNGSLNGRNIKMYFVVTGVYLIFCKKPICINNCLTSSWHAFYQLSKFIWSNICPRFLHCLP